MESITTSGLQASCAIMALIIGILGWTLTIIRNRRTANRKVDLLFLSGMAMGILISISQGVPFIGYLIIALLAGVVNIALFLAVTFLIALATET